jgi:hypothetical protein
MGLFTNPLGYAGYPPGASAPANVVNSTVRAATAAEAAAGTLNDVYISPATESSSVTLDFASPPPIGITAANTGAFTTLTSTSTTTLASGAGAAAKLGNATGTLGFFGAAGATKVTQGAITNSVTVGGVTGTIADYTDLTVYANDSNAIRDDIYQLAKGLQNTIAALRSYGLLV